MLAVYGIKISLANQGAGWFQPLQVAVDCQRLAPGFLQATDMKRLIGVILVLTAAIFLLSATSDIPTQIKELQIRVKHLEERVKHLESYWQSQSLKKKSLKIPPKSHTSQTVSKQQQPLRIELVRLEKLKDFEYVIVDVKVTNVSSSTIRGATVTCVLLDVHGKEIGYEKESIIDPDAARFTDRIETQLEPGRSMFYTFSPRVDVEQLCRILFRQERIK